MTKAPIIPGIHPANVKRNTIKIEPQPLSITAKGGNKIANTALQKLIIPILIMQISFFFIN